MGGVSDGQEEMGEKDKVDGVAEREAEVEREGE